MSTPAISAEVSACSQSQADTEPADQAFNQLAKTSSNRIQLFCNVKMSRGDVNSSEYAQTKDMSCFKRYDINQI